MKKLKLDFISVQLVSDIGSFSFLFSFRLFIWLFTAVLAIIEDCQNIKGIHFIRYTDLFLLIIKLKFRISDTFFKI